MLKTYVFLLFFYASWLNAMNVEEIPGLLTDQPEEMSKLVNGVFSIQEFPIIARKLIEAIKNESDDAAELARTIPESTLQDLLIKAARLYPLDQEYNRYPAGQHFEKYRQRLKKFNNKFITFILFQLWAGIYIKKLNEMAIWGQHATERVLFRAIKKKDLVNRIAIITRLLDNNTNGNTTKANKKAHTPFTKAIEKQRKDVMDLLRNKYANTYQKIEVPLLPQPDNLKKHINLENSLYTAVVNGNYDLVYSLLKEGAKIRGALLPLAVECKYPEIAMLLIKNGADVNYGGPLSKAIKKKYVTIAILLIKHKANINEGDPLASAALIGSYDLVELLTEKGADLNSGTPLTKAVSRKNFNIAEFLIKKGANVNLGNPLLCAIKNGSANMAALLLENGADPNEGSPLSAAIQAANLKIGALLIKKGAKINLANQDGLTPLSVLSKQKNISQNERRKWMELLSSNTSESSPALTKQDDKTQKESRKRKYKDIIHVTFTQPLGKDN